MKDIKIPFSLFDFLAVMFPGAVMLFTLYLWWNPGLKAQPEAIKGTVFEGLDSELLLATLAVLSSYLVGYMVNALSEYLIDRPANFLTENVFYSYAALRTPLAGDSAEGEKQ